MPPSRFLFYGAEVVDSPLPSPDTRLLTCLNGSTDCSSDDEMDDDQTSISPSSMDGSNCDIASDGNDIEKVRRGSGAGMDIINRGLSIYTSESEDSSAMSFSDVAAGKVKGTKAFDTNLKELCHAILASFYNPKYVLPSTEFQK